MKKARDSDQDVMLHNATSSTTLTAIERLQKLRKEVEGYRQGLRRIVADVYEVTLELKQNDKLWKRFCKDEFWASKSSNRPKIADRTTVLSCALRIAFGRGRDKDSRVSRYKKRLDPFLAEEADPADVRDELLKNGLRLPQQKSSKAKSTGRPKKEIVLSKRLQRRVERQLVGATLTLEVLIVRRPDGPLEFDISRC